MLPGQPSNDRAVGKGPGALAKSFHCEVVSENGAQIVEVARLVRPRDHLPVTISSRDCDAEDWGRLIVGVSGGGWYQSDDTRSRRKCKCPKGCSSHFMRPK